MLAILKNKIMQRQDIFTIGIDEAGRGSLAFDIVAAAVIMPPSLDHPMMSTLYKRAMSQ